MRQCREVVWYGCRRRVRFGGGCSPCTDCTGQGNDFGLIPTVKIMESGHPVQRTHFVVSFHRSISLGSYCGLKSQVVGNFGQNLRCWKNDPLRGNFQNSVLKEFIASPIHVLCANFVQFGWLEIGEIVRCLKPVSYTHLTLPTILRV